MEVILLKSGNDKASRFKLLVVGHFRYVVDLLLTFCISGLLFTLDRRDVKHEKVILHKIIVLRVRIHNKYIII